MLLQLDCPLEVRAAHITSDSSGRVRAELSLANLAAQTIVSFRGAARYVGEDGALLLEQPLDLDGLHMPPRDVSSLPVAADGAQGTADITLIISHIYYEGLRMPWKPRGGPVYIKPPLAPDEESLRQLRMVAGEDVVCYPRLHMAYWQCVCGRANADGAVECVRCGRSRGMVMRTLTRDVVRAEFPVRQRVAKQAQEDARSEARRKNRQRADSAMRYQRKMLIRRTATLLSLALILVLVGWLLTRKAWETSAPPPTPPPPVDRGTLA